MRKPRRPAALAFARGILARHRPLASPRPVAKLGGPFSWVHPLRARGWRPAASRVGRPGRGPLTVQLPGKLVPFSVSLSAPVPVRTLVRHEQTRRETLREIRTLPGTFLARETRTIVLSRREGPPPPAPSPGAGGLGRTGRGDGGIGVNLWPVTGCFENPAASQRVLTPWPPLPPGEGDPPTPRVFKVWGGGAPSPGVGGLGEGRGGRGVRTPRDAAPKHPVTGHKSTPMGDGGEGRHARPLAFETSAKRVLEKVAPTVLGPHPPGPPLPPPLPPPRERGELLRGSFSRAPVVAGRGRRGETTVRTFLQAFLPFGAEPDGRRPQEPSGSTSTGRDAPVRHPKPDRVLDFGASPSQPSRAFRSRSMRIVMAPFPSAPGPSGWRSPRRPGSAPKSSWRPAGWMGRQVRGDGGQRRPEVSDPVRFSITDWGVSVSTVRHHESKGSPARTSPATVVAHTWAPVATPVVAAPPPRSAGRASAAAASSTASTNVASSTASTPALPVLGERQVVELVRKELRSALAPASSPRVQSDRGADARLADRVVSNLERRLLVERERRGL